MAVEVFYDAPDTPIDLGRRASHQVEQDQRFRGFLLGEASRTEASRGFSGSFSAALQKLRALDKMIGKPSAIKSSRADCDIWRMAPAFLAPYGTGLRCVVMICFSWQARPNQL
ncbi:hypothetical protein [Sphingomonas sp. Ant20]|uniref:hypothetical protein n=1 Tax=Sphingomonas sp. Ant20 TaxID=104605 RepID=UPI0018E2B1D3|nr:hypothetical protein [Sphingomonas sp. Ant20]